MDHQQENPTLIQSDNGNHFEKELIDRFFDPKSYYLHSFMSSLREKETLFDDPVDTVAIGLLVDDIINSSDKKAKIEQLDHFDRFQFYRQQLYEGLNYLKQTTLSTQQMMDTVGSLGKSLAETLLDLVSNENSRNALLDLVGLDSQQHDTEPEENIVREEKQKKKSPKTKPRARKETKSKTVEPWSFFENDLNQKIDALQTHLDLFSKSQQNWKLIRRIKNDYKDLRDWAMIQGDEGIEAISHKMLLLFETVYSRALAKCAVILPILQESVKTLQAISRSGEDSAHLDIVRVMVHQIDRQRRAFPKPVDDFGISDSPPKKSKPEPETAPSVHDDEVVIEEETVSENISESEEDNDVNQSIPFSEVDRLEDLHSPESEETIQTKPETSDGSEVEDLDSEENFSEEAREEGQEDFGSIRESESLPELVDEHKDYIDQLEKQSEEENQEEQEKSTPQEEVPEDIQLPGEDDEELLAMLSELQAEQNNKDGSQKQSDELDEDLLNNMDSSDFDQHIEKLEKEYEQEQSDAEDDTADAETVVDHFQQENEHVQKGYPQEGTGDGADFISEADMYLAFARKAFQQLMKNSSNKQALEDIELACYSLKVIAEKLNYKIIYDIMHNGENLVQAKISQGNGLETAQINSLFTVFDELELMGREHKMNDPSQVAWLQKQKKALENWDQSEVNTKSGKPKKSSKTGSRKKDEEEKDPLDFLLFDDESNIFKNLLDE